MLQTLIVDDEWLDMEGLRDQIPRQLLPPMMIHTAESGIQALDILKSIPVDILITDINMPQITGIELAGIARERYPQTEIVFVSGHDDFAYAQRAVSLDIVWYLLKPVPDDELLSALLRAIGRLGAKRRESAMENAFSGNEEEGVTDQVCRYVLAHLGEKVTLSNIAAELHYSANHLGRILQDTLGMTFSAYLQKTRMHYAARLLKERRRMPVKEVARMAGYMSSDAFTRAFHQEYGVAPKEFRSHA